MIHTISIQTASRTEFVNITRNVQKVVSSSNVKSGICCVYVPHTTAGLTINEGADPSVEQDIQTMLNRLVPSDAGYRHLEGNSDAHIKTSMVGSSELIIINGGKLQLGTWQAIFFCEFDGARSRKVQVKILAD